MTDSPAAAALLDALRVRYRQLQQLPGHTARHRQRLPYAAIAREIRRLAQAYDTLTAPAASSSQDQPQRDGLDGDGWPPVLL